MLLHGYEAECLDEDEEDEWTCFCDGAEFGFTRRSALRVKCNENTTCQKLKEAVCPLWCDALLNISSAATI